MENKVILNENRNRCMRSEAISRTLLRRGHTIMDIKPDKDNRDRSVCVFSHDDTLNSDIDDIRAMRKNGVPVSPAPNVQRGINGICVLDASTARPLIRLGHTVRDIAPNKDNRDRTVFIFNYDDTIKDDIITILNAARENKTFHEFTSQPLRMVI